MPIEPASVFLSYSQDTPEHAARVKQLAAQLQASGVTVALDQAVAPEPAEGWTLWCRQHALHARTVLVVCSTRYKQRWEQRELPKAGLGVGWEAHLLRAKFVHEDHLTNLRMRPVVLPGFTLEDVPIELRDWKVYRPLESSDDLTELIDRIRKASDDRPPAPEPPPPPAAPAPGEMVDHEAIATPEAPVPVPVVDEAPRTGSVIDARPSSKLRTRLPMFVEMTAALACLAMLVLDVTTAKHAAGSGASSKLTACERTSRPPHSPIGREVVWARVEGGTFVMRPHEVSSAATSAIQLSIGSFHVSRHEITVKQYQECVSQGGCDAPKIEDGCNSGIPDRENHPVNCVSWNDASAYVGWISKQVHKQVRLLTEAEYEYLASNHGKLRYPWGNEAPTCDRANLSFDDPRTPPGTTDVCSYESSDSSLCDLIGNVWEWTSDAYDPANPAVAKTSDAYDPTNPAMARILRGGSWRERPEKVDAGTRNGRDPFARLPTIGFRIAYSD